ncbi:MAG: MFS transporter [Halieaceae bacterium]|nr:MFS transporter [Halieaceae bacterium]
MADENQPVSLSELTSVKEVPWPNPAYAWYVVTVLTLAYTVSFIDRQILNLLVEPIKGDLGISDTQISLLQGLAFAIFYSLLGVPIGRLADRSNRRNVIALGIFLWCLMTAACGLARNFYQLFLARIGVGIGEAALSPPAYSIIADYFPPERLARATGMYALGVYAGAGIAMLVGGAVIGMISDAEPISIPYVGLLRPWQMAFIAVGIPGLLACALMFTIREPIRRDSFANLEPQKTTVSFAEVIDFIKSRKRFFLSIFVGLSMIGMVIVAILSWTPTYFIRLHGWTASEIGFRYGIVLLIFGTSGSFLGGWFADWIRSRGHSDPIIRTTIGVSTLATPFAILMPLSSFENVAYLALIPVTFFLASPVGLTAAAVQIVTPNRMRAQITAIYFLIVAMIGSGIGPLTVALTTDYLYGEDMAVGKSIALICGVLLPIGILSLWSGLNTSFNEAEKKSSEI